VREALDEIVLSYDINLSNSALSFKMNVHKYCPPELICDKARLQQIIRNLLSNAIKYARSRVYLEVEYLKEKALLQVVVTDDGFGFPHDKMGYIIDCIDVAPDILEKLPKHKGIGMGLHICKSILGKLGGKIIINTGLNTPTSFKIQIPSQLPQQPDAIKKDRKSNILFESVS
jgi:signal transduction histidine kinase